MPTHLSRESTFSLFSGPSKVFHSLSALTAQKLAVSLDAQLGRDRSHYVVFRGVFFVIRFGISGNKPDKNE